MQSTGVGQSIPQSHDCEQIKQVVDTLHCHHETGPAAIVLLAKVPACAYMRQYADLPRLSREAEDVGKIKIQNATKGDRTGASASIGSR